MAGVQSDPSISYTEWECAPDVQALYAIDDHTIFYIDGSRMFVSDHTTEVSSSLPGECVSSHGSGKSLFLICQSASTEAESWKIYKVSYVREPEKRIAVDFIRQLLPDEKLHGKLLTTSNFGTFFYRICDDPRMDGIMLDTKLSDGFEIVDIHRNKLIYIKVEENCETKIEQESRNVIMITTDSFLHYSSASDEIPLWFLYRGENAITVFDIDKLECWNEEPALRSVKLGGQCPQASLRFFTADPASKQCDCANNSPQQAIEEDRKRLLAEYPSEFLTHFRVRKILGQGSFGRVYQAVKNGSEYAVKRIAIAGRQVTKEKLETFRDWPEIREMQKLKHDNIVKYEHSWIETPPELWQLNADQLITDEIEFNRDENDKEMSEKSYTEGAKWFNISIKGTAILYIQMEVCKYSLKRWLSKNEERPLRRMRSWFSQIVDAVAYMHSKDVIHRDLKPGNILFAEEDYLKICDFGIATTIAREEDEEITKTRTTERGTDLYWAPEQQSPYFARYTSKVDVFSLGLILAEMCVVMDAEERKKIFDDYRDVNAVHNRSISGHPGLDSLIASLASLKPSDRPKSADILADSFFDEELNA